MKLFEGVIDGLICIAAIVLALVMIIVGIKIASMMYRPPVRMYPEETAAPRITGGERDENEEADDPGSAGSGDPALRRVTAW